MQIGQCNVSNIIIKYLVLYYRYCIGVIAAVDQRFVCNTHERYLYINSSAACQSLRRSSQICNNKIIQMINCHSRTDKPFWTITMLLLYIYFIIILPEDFCSR